MPLGRVRFEFFAKDFRTKRFVTKEIKDKVLYTFNQY